MNAPAAVTSIHLPAVGQPFAGGILLGRLFVGLTACALIAAPKAEGEQEDQPWNKHRDRVAGALSNYDGLANTRAMLEAGSEIALWAGSLRIDGFDDWYLPSRGELLLAWDAGLEGDEAFAREWYWSSTQYASDPEWAWYQDFSSGYQDGSHKSFEGRVRAVRRVAI